MHGQPLSLKKSTKFDFIVISRIATIWKVKVSAVTVLLCKRILNTEVQFLKYKISITLPFKYLDNFIKVITRKQFSYLLKIHNENV
jgi:hypothetical protein